MLQDNFQPIASERNATTCDFTDRLRQLTNDVLVIELAVGPACNVGDIGAAASIVMSCRKLRADIDELADMVLPPITEEEKAVIAAALDGRQP